MEKSPLKIIFFGTPDFTVPILKTLQENFNLVGVVTSPDKKVGRKQILTPSAVAEASQNSQVIKTEAFNDQTVQQIKELKPDLFVVAAYGKLIPQKVLEIPRAGALNVHPSCLPKYRGASPIQNAILNNEREICLSIIQMDEKMDHGPVIFTKEFLLSHNDNFQTLSTKLFDEASEILPEIIADFVQEKITPQPQNDEKATFTSLVKKEDGYFDINTPPSPEDLDKLIRAYYPWPNAWTKWNGKIVKFYPGKLVQIEGKNPVKFEDFLNGYPDFPLKSL